MKAGEKGTPRVEDPILILILGKYRLSQPCRRKVVYPRVREYPQTQNEVPLDYKGPLWMVLDLREDTDLEWVKSYELFWRSGGGRTWNALGTFKGNKDATTEVAHLLTGISNQGIRCQYLRFVPLECEGGGAMRVGIYGEAPKDSNTNKKRGNHGGESPDETFEQIVRYEVHETAHLLVKDALVRDIFGRRNESESSWHSNHTSNLWGNSEGGRRLTRKLQARLDAARHGDFQPTF